MRLLELIIEFFITGLLSVGGGLATLPFLYDMGERHGWFTDADVLNMIAVSESTPGPIGVNMATYTGFITAGIPGAVLSTLSLVLPSYIIIIIVFKFVQKFKDSPVTQSVFHMLRPASAALITAAGLSVAALTLFPGGFDYSGVAAFFSGFDYKALILAAVIFAGTKLWKRGHPIVFILIAAVCGMIFSM